MKNPKYILKNIYSNYIRIFKILLSIDFKFLVLLLFSSIMLGLGPYISVKLTQTIINSIQTPGFPLKSLFIILAIFIFYNIFITLFTLLINYYTALFQFKINKYVEIIILEKSGHLALKDFENTESYNKIQRAQASNNIYTFFTYSINVIKLLVTLISSISILLSWKWWCVLLIVFISLLSTFMLNKLNEIQYEMIRKRTGDEREKWYYKFLLTNDIAFKEIKLYDLSKYFIEKFTVIYEKIVNQDKNFLKQSTKTNFIISLLEEITTAFIFVLIIMDTYLGKILIGDTLAYIRTITNIRSTISNLMLQFSSIYKDNLYINQVFEFLNMSTESNVKNNKSKIDEINSIRVENLSYKYVSSNKVYSLKNLNFILQKGDNIAIVGRNGSGKSTLVKILVGLYDNYEGNIFINDVELRKIDKNSFRTQISILFQDFTKYELSLTENIAVSDISKQNNILKLTEVLKKTDLNSHIPNLNKRLGFWFDNGIQISGGEWIKIGIGRVFFKNASLLIFDEPNAALDSISERKILEKIKSATSKKISLVVTHRISTIPLYANKILVLHEGNIIDFNTHNILIKNCQVYQNLYQSDLKM